jgi:hypothetical protein
MNPALKVFPKPKTNEPPPAAGLDHSSGFANDAIGRALCDYGCIEGMVLPPDLAIPVPISAPGSSR